MCCKMFILIPYINLYNKHSTIVVILATLAFIWIRLTFKIGILKPSTNTDIGVRIVTDFSIDFQ